MPLAVFFSDFHLFFFRGLVIIQRNFFLSGVCFVLAIFCLFTTPVQRGGERRLHRGRGGGFEEWVMVGVHHSRRAGG